MSLRIGFDLDGVLADMDSAIQRETGRLCEQGLAQDSGQAPASDPAIRTARHVSSGARSAVWSAVRSTENFWEMLDEIEPGSISALARMADARRWEVLFLTTRPSTAGSTSQRQSQRWLDRYGFTLPSVYVVSASRGKIAEALGLDVLVDDRVENCLDVVLESHAKSVLVARELETGVVSKARRLGIYVVTSIDECLAWLSAHDDAQAKRPEKSRRRRLFPQA